MQSRKAPPISICRASLTTIAFTKLLFVSILLSVCGEHTDTRWVARTRYGSSYALLKTILLLSTYNPHLALLRRLPLRREFSFFPLLVALETTLKLPELLSRGELFLWSISLLSPAFTRPERIAERLALLRDARSFFASSELWNLSYSCAIPAAVRLRLPFSSTYQNFPAIIMPLGI